MKYWLFDGKEASGPFDPEELKKIPGFSPNSLIAPDGADTAGDWKAASYYLIKPPSAARSEPPREEKPKVSAPSVVEPEVFEPAPAAQAPAPRRSPVVPVVLGLAALAAVGGAAYYARQKKMKAEAVQASTIPQEPTLPVPMAPQTPAASPPSPAAAADQAAQADALNLVQKFKIVSAGGRYPADPFDVLSPKKWKAPKTLGDLYEMRPLEALSLEALQESQRRGQSVAQAATDIRKDPDGWKAFSQKFLKNAGKVKWEAQAVNQDMMLVTAHLRSPRTGAPEHRGFEADLKKRAIKPTDFDAWCDVDAKACAKWARRNLKLGETPDQAAIASAVQPYVWPRLKTKMRPQAPGTRPSALGDVDDDLAGDVAPTGPEPVTEDKIPEPAPAPVTKAPRSRKGAKKAAAAPPPQSGDADDFDPLSAAQEPPAEHAAPSPQAVAEKPVPPPTREMPPPEAAPAPQPQRAAPPPSAAPPMSDSKPAGGPPSRPAVPPSPGAKKSVTDMSVNELEKYLNRKD